MRGNVSMTAALFALVFALPAVSVLGETVTCVSVASGYSYCPCDTSRGVVLIRQQNDSACRFNESWGFDDRGIWVDRGCAADFRLGADAATPTGSDGGAGDAVPCETPVLYQNRNLQGDWLVLERDNPDLHQSGFGDRSASVCIPDGWTLTFYDGIGYSGPPAELPGPVVFRDLSEERPADRDWSDRISSVRVARTGGSRDRELDPGLDAHVRELCQVELRQQIQASTGAETEVRFSSSRITGANSEAIELAGDGVWEDRFGSSSFRYSCQFEVAKATVGNVQYSLSEPSRSPTVSTRLCEAALVEKVRWEIDKRATLELVGKAQFTNLSPVDEELRGAASIKIKDEQVRVRYECLVNTADHRVVRIDFRTE